MPIPLPSPTSQRPGHWRGVLLHAARVGVFAAIVWLIREQHLWTRAQLAGRDAAAITVDQLREFFPTADRLSDWDPRRGSRAVFGADGTQLGSVVQTLPQSQRIIGYSGPTNLLLAFGRDERILGMQILSSGDTRDHVADVRKSARFQRAFNGLTWEEAARKHDVDAVSGATLTSLAIIESINHRLGGGQPSLRFPDELQLDEVTPFFKAASRIVARDDQPAIQDVLNEQGEKLGFVIRSTPAADAVMGYQGPTDTLLAFNTAGKSIGVSLRKSYDNEPYVGYVRQDVGYLSLFEQRTLAELAKLDPKAEEIEGVSGATMTSMAVANAMPKAAQRALTAPATTTARVLLSARDLGTMIVVLLAVIMAFTRLRGVRTLRMGFQFLLVIYLGFVNGDLVSQAQLVGWAQNGVPWRIAAGLVALTAAALLLPIFSRKQLYCHQICPYGAAQQLVKLQFSNGVKLPGGVNRARRLVPFGLLAVVIFVAMTHRDWNLASLEPFDAFSFRVAGLATVIIAAGGLIASCFVPMAYCRFGCPTGLLLDYLRYHGDSDRFTPRDLGAVALLALAIGLRFMS